MKNKNYELEYCPHCYCMTKTIKNRFCGKCNNIKKEIILPKSKHELGYTYKEVLDIIRPFKIHHKKFWKKLGRGNTCSLDRKTREILYYSYDIIRTIKCCLENRNMYNYEWD